MYGPPGTGSCAASAAIAPREEFVDTCDRVVCDFGEDPSEPGLRINAAELGGYNLLPAIDERPSTKSIVVYLRDAATLESQ